MKEILVIVLLSVFAYSATSFRLYKMQESEDVENTILIVGGIHGNEPGSYFSPAIFAHHYKITKNAVWIIPALNLRSIRINARGRYGDMNRKFRYIAKNDRDFTKVKEVKELILNKRVDLILNLHDGHGFFRDNWENDIKNPKAWGQSSVIDNHKINADVKFAKLYEIAQEAVSNANEDEDHKYKVRVKNTNTKDKNPEQQNSLTYFAFTHNKPAFAIETSKNIKNLALKVLYQLKTIEGYLKVADIEYQRDFDLDIDSIKKILNKYETISINNNIKFNISNIRNYISFFPLKKGHNDFKFSHPLGSVSYRKGLYHLHIGNKHIATLKPQYFKTSDKNIEIPINIDGVDTDVKIGSSIKVKANFEVKASNNIRVNVIGYGNRNDNFKTIYKKSIQSKYSLDTINHLYRIEFYKQKLFLGMVIVDFR
jgi:hypothetical protein